MSLRALPNGAAASAGPPVNIEAEQALLGVILYENSAFHLLDGRVTGETFYEPFHGHLFDAAAELIGKNKLAEPIVLMQALKSDPAFEQMGGLRYLAELVDRAPPMSGATGYADVLVDLALRRRLIALGGELALAARTDSDWPAADQLETLERSLLALQMNKRSLQLTTAADAVGRVFDYLDAPAGRAGGVLTGLGPMDNQLGPLMPGDLIVLGGRPGMGKSALASVIALNVASQVSEHHPNGRGVIEINGEMSVDQMMRRHLTDRAQHLFGSKAPSYSAIRKRTVERTERDMLERAAAEIRPLPLRMLKRTGLTLSSLRSLIRRQTAEWIRKDIPLGAVIVDHVGLLKTDDRSRSRYEEQTEISNGLKELADELQVPIIGLAQLNRETEKRDNKRPTLSDLRDTGAWEQDADIVIGVYRDGYYAQREPEPADKAGPLAWSDWDSRRKSRTIEAIALKVREGDTGTIELWGDMRTNAIRGAEPETNGGFL